MLNKLQKSQVRDLMKHPGWSALMTFCGIMIDNWQKEDIKTDTEWETMWRVAQREAKRDSLLEFFDKLDREIID